MSSSINYRRIKYLGIMMLLLLVFVSCLSTRTFFKKNKPFDVAVRNYIIPVDSVLNGTFTHSNMNVFFNSDGTIIVVDFKEDSSFFKTDFGQIYIDTALQMNATTLERESVILKYYKSYEL